MNKEELQNEADDGVIELVDDGGNIIKFRLLDVTEYKGQKYTLLLAAEPNDEIAEDEVIIFRLNEKDEALEPIEDEALLQEIFDFYQQETEGEDVYSDEDEA
ncbi:MAG TPA: DUF1292 domain-containing protein [Candidatus Coproplasma excrementigallinarum]|uniref:DUF1292 domain-containing protein n=1 Tax=Candidatus Coproplasma excrementigallinarum TaxID=2840747 RepID=A0A9D1MJU2_9FIRM|nr:DUF1292 domain-containing protein [Candidatus Coproplasma excrementigallinarum]